MAEPFEEEVNCFLECQVVVRFDYYQVLEFGYVSVDFWVLELQFVKLVSSTEFARGVYEFFPEGLFELDPHRRYVMVYRVESSDGVDHVPYP